MNLLRPAWLSAGLALLLSGAGAVAQGTFQNLGFESATVVGPPGTSVNFGQAFPGWTGYVGGVQRSGASYDSVPMSTAGFSILDTGFSGPSVAGVIAGNFTAFLMSGAAGPGQQADTTLAQTGLVPVGTESLLFKAQLFSAFEFFSVTLGGKTLSLTPLQSGSNYTLYGADIHAWAGQTAALAFTSFYPHPQVGQIPVYLDAIEFSPQSIPEPSVLGLSALGALLLGWRILGGRR